MLHANRNKLILLTFVSVVAIILLFLSREYLSLQSLSQFESDLKNFQREHPIIVDGSAFLIYVIITGLSIPGATALSLSYAWFFGFVRGLVLVSFASTAGATMAFLLSRYFLRDWVQRRFRQRLEKFNSALETDGPFYLFTLRLIPAVPFFVINVVMGLTKIRVWSFWWISQLGMLPVTAIYVYAGSRVPDLQTLESEGLKSVFTSAQLIQIFVAFGLIGLLPLVIRKFSAKT
jgi:uncharacterized membrane protein YdjX (TVP38/TMEM64 family)